MDLRDLPADRAFRAEVREFLASAVVGEFAALGGRGGSGDETYGFETRLKWERVLADAGWTCLGWPTEYGGRGRQYRRAGHLQRGVRPGLAPGRVSILGRGCSGPP